MRLNFFLTNTKNKMIKKRTCFNERTDQYKIPSEDILILQTIILVSVEQEHLTAKKKSSSFLYWTP